MEVLIAENRELKRQLYASMRVHPEKEAQPNHLRGLLKDLYDCAAANCHRTGQGNRYPEFLKELSTMTYLLGGLQLYEFLSSNLPLPSVSTARQTLYSTEIIEEGKIRMKELRHYLELHNEPLQVFLSEDATRVTVRILYCPGQNQIVGCTPKLDSDGCPMVGSFPATSADVITSYFSTNDRSQNAYVIMAQPMCGSPPFCLCLYGTDNKFQGSEVFQRWTKITSLAATEDIKIVGFASDGDSRLMKAMRFKTFLKNPVTPWNWFQSNIKTPSVCFQDFVHLLVKLKTRLLKPSVILALGPDRLVSKGHLVELIETISKDQHQLFSSYLDSKDKMNFRTAYKMCTENVTKLLKTKIVEGDGTAMFLDMMRETFRSCADPSIVPLTRIEMMWKWVILLRIWRKWLLKHPDYSLSDNFISSNSYYCMELNAHALIQSLVLCRDGNYPHLFKPWLWSSQPCESLFRSARSLTSTFSTVINFSILEMLQKLRRIEYLSKATFKLKDRYQFPRQLRAFEAIKKSEFVWAALPSDQEINTAVQNALQEANKVALKFHLIKEPLKTVPLLEISLISNLEHSSAADEEDDDSDDVIITGEDEEDSNSNLASREMEEFNSDLSSDVLDDVSLVTTGCFKTFNDLHITPSSAFVKVKNSDGGYSIIKKTSFCWLLSNGHSSLSNDRLIRVRADVSKQLPTTTTKLSAPTQEETLSMSSWCAFKENNTIIIGKILAFRFMHGSTKKQQEYVGMTASVKGNTRQLGVMCSWFSPPKKGNSVSLEAVQMDNQGYYGIENYLCTLPRPVLKGSVLKLTCALHDVKRFLE